MTLMKTDKKEQFRHEAKYLIGLKEKALLTQRFESILNLDRHAQNGGYTIRSLYFDDYWNSSYEEKAAGILMRKKYRIRIYNFSDRSIKLERKKKFVLHSPHPLCREFYFECVTNVMRPRVIVDYEREPWVYDAGTVRLTFDSNVRAAVGSYDIFDPNLPTIPVLPEGKLVFEVKYTEMQPQIIKDIIPPGASEFIAVSKYVLCYEKTRYLHDFEYWFDTDY